jgi:hypothetical protein
MESSSRLIVQTLPETSVGSMEESLFAPNQPMAQCIQTSEVEAVADLLNANH